MSQVEVVADGRRYIFNAETVVICGRSADADVPLTDRRVGRTHVRLSSVEGIWYLTDLASTNGTWIDGQRVTQHRIDNEVTAYLGNPHNGALLFLRTTEGAAPTPKQRPEAGVGTVLVGAEDAVFSEPTETRPVMPSGGPTSPAPPAGPTATTSPPPPASTAPVTQLVAPVTAPLPPGPFPPTFNPPAPPPPPAAYPPAAALPTAAPGVPVQQHQYNPPTYIGPSAAPGAPAPVLVVRLGTRTLVFPAGQPVRIGRDPGLEARTDHPLVSRNYHGLITSTPDGATYTDSSSRGTYHNGKQLKAPLRITAPTTLRLGDPATGEELGITPPLTLERLQANQRSAERGRKLRIGGLVAAALAILVVAGVAIVLAGRPNNPSTSAGPPPTTNGVEPASLSQATLQYAETATVRLLIGTEQDANGWGSGTVISPDGLILTNAHVAAPSTPGAAVALAQPGSSLDPNPPFVTVEFATNDASSVVAKYRAKPVAVDGYLDLAVVKIFATNTGAPVDPSKLKLPYLKLGNVASMHLDQDVTILGYPGVSGSESITVTTGILSTFIPDPLGHVKDPRFQLETTARVAHGNSGGAAITNAGELIGVPSLSIPGEGSDLSWRLRSVAQAVPLIEAAKAGRQYASMLLVGLTGHEQVAGIGVGPDQQTACGASPSTPSTDQLVIGINVDGASPGLDVAVSIRLPDGTELQRSAGAGQSLPGLPEFNLPQSRTCLTLRISAGGLGLDRMPIGPYGIELFGGPNLDSLGSRVIVEVTS